MSPQELNAWVDALRELVWCAPANSEEEEFYAEWLCAINPRYEAVLNRLTKQ